MKFFKQLLVSSRPISWVNTAYPYAAGYLLVTVRVDALLIIGSLFFLIPYNVLMYGLNDVFDYESDMRNPRKGGIEGGVVAPELHAKIIITCVAMALPFVIWLLLQGSRSANAVLIGVLFMVVAYSAPVLRFKERPVLDSFTSSSHFWGPLAYALALTGSWSQGRMAVLAFLLWGMASHALGAVQDITADREAGIGSIASALGAARTIWFVIVMYVASSIVVASAYGWLGLVLGGMGIVYAANAWPYRRLSDSQATKAHAAWQRFIWLNYITGAVLTIGLILQQVGF